MPHPENRTPALPDPTFSSVIKLLPITIIIVGQDALQRKDFEAIKLLYAMPLFDEVKKSLNSFQQQRVDLVSSLCKNSLNHRRFVSITNELFDSDLPKVPKNTEKIGNCLCLLALGGSVYNPRFSYENYLSDYKQQLIKVAKRRRVKPESLTPEHLSQAILNGSFNPLPFETDLNLIAPFKYNPSRFLATAPFFILANVDGVRNHQYRAKKRFEQIFDPVNEIRSELQSVEEQERFDLVVNLLRKSVGNPDFDRAFEAFNQTIDSCPYEKKVTTQLLILLSLGASVLNEGSYDYYLHQYQAQMNKLNRKLSRPRNSVLLAHDLTKFILSGKFNLIPD